LVPVGPRFGVTSTPLCGRDRERAALNAYLDRVRGGRAECGCCAARRESGRVHATPNFLNGVNALTKTHGTRLICATSWPATSTPLTASCACGSASRPLANQPSPDANATPDRDARLVEARQHADRRERETRDLLSDTFTAARAAANDPRWRDPKAHLLLRIRGLQESQLIAEAPTLTGRTLA